MAAAVVVPGLTTIIFPGTADNWATACWVACGLVETTVTGTFLSAGSCSAPT